MDEANDIVIEAWNTVLFDKFRRFKHLLVNGLAIHSDEVLARYPYPQGARVLDIGCGFGDSTQGIAKQVGPKGEAVGVDCCPEFRRRLHQGCEGCRDRQTPRSSPPTCKATICGDRTTLPSLASDDVLHAPWRRHAQYPQGA